MEVEPRNSLQRSVIHEASHCIAAAAHHCPLGVLRVWERTNACYFALGPRDDVEIYSSIQAAVALAGGVGERLFCGDDGHLHLGTVSDDAAATAAIKDSRGWGWGVPTARAAYTSLVERILLRNERLVYAVARELTQRRYLSDTAQVVADAKHFYGFSPSPLMRQDWRVVLDAELATQRRAEQLLAEEVARQQAWAAERLMGAR